MNKKTVTFFMLFLAILGIRNTFAYEENFTSGKDWLESMSRREKYMSLIPPTLLLNEYDIHPRLSVPDYVQLIDKQLELNPRLVSEDISNIYTATIYAVEPELRAPLRELEIHLLRGDEPQARIESPELSIDASLET